MDTNQIQYNRKNSNEKFGDKSLQIVPQIEILELSLREGLFSGKSFVSILYLNSSRDSFYQMAQNTWFMKFIMELSCLDINLTDEKYFRCDLSDGFRVCVNLDGELSQEQIEKVIVLRKKLSIVDIIYSSRLMQLRLQYKKGIFNG